MSLLVPIIVAFIIALQIFFFKKNLSRMKEYKQIFAEETSWGIAHHLETGFVTGIYGRGNEVFESIKDSINKYLGNNSGSVIDFSLLKDAVDRHCDSVENDINTLTPTPLYCGLAGTMVGVIVGLGSLLTTGSITALLSSGSGDFGTAAQGVNDLLAGVAWAMLASIMGILLTTIASLLFKRYKLQGEFGKNSFLAWLQAKLLPELPSDTSDALNSLVKNLNRFNAMFHRNTEELRSALGDVNESYRIQGDIIQAVYDMDMMKAAKANVYVLKELKGCTDKLEQFNQYLNDVHGYTDVIHKFTTQFEQEADRLHVLESIRDFFERHKGEMSKDVADVDNELKKALSQLKESASEGTNDLSSTLQRQAIEFKKVIEEERDSFEKINGEIRALFETNLKQMPMLEGQLAEITGIPSKLDKLIERMERSNNSLASQVSKTMKHTAEELVLVSPNGELSSNIAPRVLPGWMKWTMVVSVVLIALACILNAAHNIWFAGDSAPLENVDKVTIESGDSTLMMPAGMAVEEDSLDTVQLQPVLKSSSDIQVAPAPQAPKSIPGNKQDAQKHP